MNIKPFISKKFLGFAGLALASAVVFRDGIAFAMGDRVSYFTGKEVAWKLQSSAYQLSFSFCGRHRGITPRLVKRWQYPAALPLTEAAGAAQKPLRPFICAILGAGSTMLFPSPEALWQMPQDTRTDPEPVRNPSICISAEYHSITTSTTIRIRARWRLSSQCPQAPSTPS